MVVEKEIVKIARLPRGEIYADVHLATKFFEDYGAGNSDACILA